MHSEKRQHSSSLLRSTLRPEDIRLHQVLGEGASGIVYCGTFIPTRTPVAIKIMGKCQFAQKVPLHRLKRELKAMRNMQHPNICKLYDFIQTENHYCLVMQLAQNGDLLERLRAKGPIVEEEAGRLFSQLIGAVHYMHSRGFVHRDIKPENLFLDGENNLVLGDFGFATKWSPSSYQTDYCGSLHYAAPEVVGRGLVRGPEADVWSCGAVLLALVTARLPFTGNTEEQLVSRVMNGKYIESPIELSSNLYDLLRGMMEPNQSKRLTVEEVIRHPWVQRHLPIQTVMPKSEHKEVQEQHKTDKKESKYHKDESERTKKTKTPSICSNSSQEETTWNSHRRTNERRKQRERNYYFPTFQKY